MSQTSQLPLILPLLLPLFAGALSLLLWRSATSQRYIALLGTAGLLAAGLWLLYCTQQSGFVVMQMGGWQAPYGITFVADLLSAVLVVLTGMIGLMVAIYAQVAIPSGHEKFGYYPLMHLLLAGVTGSFLTGDLFNLFVWFEVMLLASFALLALGGEPAQMEGAIKYVTLNLFASALFLSSVGLLYGMTGTLNLADIALKLAPHHGHGMVNVLATLFMVAFGIKAAAFPLFFWLPSSYHTPLVAISALFAGLLTKVGVYALYRIFTLIFVHDPGYTHSILLVCAGLTMLTGVLGAAAQFEFRRILAFHSISQIGYMLLGLALNSPLGLIAGIYYILHHGLVKTNLFLISGVSARLLGSHDLARLGGVYRQRPGLALLFLLSALSLAGLPPLSGFFGKFLILRASLAAEAWLSAAVALLVGLLTLYSMLKIWAEVFWKPLPDGVNGARLRGEVRDPGLKVMLLPVALLSLASLLMGLLAQPVLEVLTAMARQLTDPSLYISAVLGGKP